MMNSDTDILVPHTPNPNIRMVKPYWRRVYHTKRIVRLDGDLNLQIDPTFLKSQLKRAYHHSQESLQSCIQHLSSEWSLDPSPDRQAMFYVLETEEKLLAARYRIGQDHQLVVVGSASKHGAFGSRIKILKYTSEFVEPTIRDGKSWRRDVWRVWDPFAKRSAQTSDDYWPPVVRLLQNTTESNRKLDSEFCLISAETHSYSGVQNGCSLVSEHVQRMNKDSSSEADSDVPLRRKQQYLVINSISSDTDEDTPLCKLKKLSALDFKQRDLDQICSSANPDRESCPLWSTDSENVASSCDNNKDYHY